MFRQQALAKAARPGASVAGVALAHGVNASAYRSEAKPAAAGVAVAHGLNANLAQKWRRQARDEAGERRLPEASVVS